MKMSHKIYETALTSTCPRLYAWHIRSDPAQPVHSLFITHSFTPCLLHTHSHSGLSRTCSHARKHDFTKWINLKKRVALKCCWMRLKAEQWVLQDFNRNYTCDHILCTFSKSCYKVTFSKVTSPNTFLQSKIVFVWSCALYEKTTPKFLILSLRNYELYIVYWSKWAGDVDNGVLPKT